MKIRNLFRKIKKNIGRGLVSLLISSTLVSTNGCNTYLGYNLVDNIDILEIKSMPHEKSEISPTKVEDFDIKIKRQKAKEKVWYKYSFGKKLGEILLLWPAGNVLGAGIIDLPIRLFGGNFIPGKMYAEHPPNYFARLSHNLLFGPIINPFQCVICPEFLDIVRADYEKSLEPAGEEKIEWRRANNIIQELERMLQEGDSNKIHRAKKANVYYTIGKIYTFIGSFDKAIEEYRKATAISEEFKYKAYIDLGLAYLSRGWYDNAEEGFLMASRENPEATLPYYYRAQISLSKGLHEEASRMLKKITEKEPNNLEVHFALVDIYERKNLEDEALEEYKKIIEINPNNAYAHYGRGNIFKKKSKNKEAEEAWKRAIEINPNFADVRHNLAVHYYENKDYSKALKEWEKVKEIDPSYLNVDKNINLAKEKNRN